MRYQYLVILKKESERATDLLSFFLCLFSALCFSYIQVRSGQIDYLPLAATVILIAGLIFNLVRRRRRQVRYRSLLLLSAVGWIGMTTIPWVSAVFFILFFLEAQTKRPLEIGFDPNRIVVNSLIRRTYSWSDFNNVVLKDGLLTLDFSNNKLLQKEVADDEDEDDADEEEFNMYCRQRLSAAAGSNPSA
ncbi:MAG TPA: hypothetical protein VL727_25255 [Puia sp.]|jgi:hypothetical protein|nr:hypothetical protein [Puia sp.]